MLSRHAAVEFASNLPPHVFCATIGYLEVVEQLCSEVVILSEGRVVAHDRVDRLRQLEHEQSLEHVFVKLAVHHDVQEAARSIIDTVRA